MAMLGEILVAPSKKTAVVHDCCTLIDEEVAEKSGFSGLAIKAGYGAVKGIKPGFVRHVVEDLLPEFAAALDPLFQEAVAQGRGVSGHFTANADRAAEALLAITDRKAERSKSGVVRGTYSKLRGSAKKNVAAAIPRLGKLIEKHTA